MNEIETLFLERLIRVVGKNGLKRECHDYSYSANMATDEIGIRIIFDIDFEYRKRIEHLSGQMYILPQYKIERYTVDFYFGGNIEGICPTLAIEIDGHEWHEKTKEQAIKDRKRDRYLLINTPSTPTMRFTGSEIYNNAKDPYYDVLDYPVSFSVFQKVIMLEEEEDEKERKTEVEMCNVIQVCEDTIK